MLRLRLLCFASLAFAAVSSKGFAQTQAPPAEKAADLDRQSLLRKIHFGNRELHLPVQLENDELQMKNEELRFNIAKLESSAPDVNRLAIDQYLVEESKEAIDVATSFAQVWSRLGAPEMQDQLSALEGEFDEADKKCHSLDEEHHPIRFRTVDEAQAACFDLHAIYVAVSKLHIAIPNGWPSIFKDDSGYRARVGFGFFMADTDQLKRDQASHFDAKYKERLINQDQSLIRDDRLVWLMEISSQDTAAFNANHPDHQMGDAREILDTMKKFRQEFANLVDGYRKEVQRYSEPIQQKRKIR